MATHRTANRAQFNFEIPIDEIRSVTDLAKDLGISKSVIVRKGLKIIYDFIVHEKAIMDAELRAKLLKSGKIPPMSEILDDRKLRIEQLLNKMTYDEILKVTKNVKK